MSLFKHATPLETAPPPVEQLNTGVYRLQTAGSTVMAAAVSSLEDTPLWGPIVRGDPAFSGKFVSGMVEGGQSSIFDTDQMAMVYQAIRGVVNSHLANAMHVADDTDGWRPRSFEIVHIPEATPGPTRHREKPVDASVVSPRVITPLRNTAEVAIWLHHERRTTHEVRVGESLILDAGHGYSLPRRVAGAYVALILQNNR